MCVLVVAAVVTAALPLLPAGVLGGPSPAAAYTVTTRESVTSSGGELNSGSYWSAITPDARFVLFLSDATNAVSGDTNGQPDIFLKDRSTGTTTRQSVASSGAQASSGVSNTGTVSDDGQRIVFPSGSSNLVAGDTNGVADIFLRDRAAGTTTRVSVSSSGTQANGGLSNLPAISGDGKWIAFTSDASNLVSGDTNAAQDAFLREVSTGIVTRISLAAGGIQGNGGSSVVDISSDGRYVLLTSAATNLVAGDTNAVFDLFRYDRVTNTIARVSLSNTGAQLTANTTSGTLSADGSRLLFWTTASNAVTADTNGFSDAFLRSISAGTTERVSIGNNEEQGNNASSYGDLSNDGRYVAFDSYSTNLVSGDGFGRDVFVRDRALGTTTRVSNGTDGSPNNGDSDSSRITGDGRYINLTSAASNLVSNDTNANWDVFVVDTASPFPTPPVPDGGALNSVETYGSGACGASASQSQATQYPVNTATGNFWHTFEDLAVRGRGIHLEMGRTYNSADAANTGWFGYGWSSSYESTLTVDGTSAVVERGNGSRVTFAQQGGVWAAPPRAASTLVANGDGTWTFTCRADDILTFDAQGRLVSRKDTNSDGVTLSYSTPGEVIVTDSAGKTLTLTFTGSRVTNVADSATPQRSLTYSYNGAGDLTDVIDVAAGHTTFTYDGSHRMATMRSPKYFGDSTTSPSPVVTNHYAADGRVDWQTDQLGRQTTLEYSGDPLGANGETVVTNPKGNKTRYVYAYGILTEETRGWYSGTEASTWRYEYDPTSTATTKVIDPSGHEWLATYDSAGNRLTSTDPLNHSMIATYNALNRPLTITDGKNVTTTFTYDTSGNPLTRSTPWLEGPPNTNQIITYQHDDPTHPGDVTSMTDAGGKPWTYTYDQTGNLASITDPLNHTTKTCYDQIGRRTAQISARGVAAGVSCATSAPAPYTTYFTYNPYGDVLTRTDPLGHEATYTYDGDRHLQAVLDPTNHTTAYTFDPAGEPIQTLRADTTTTREDFWPDGALKTRYDGANNRTDYGYDPQGRLTSTTDALGRVTNFTYDPNGNRVAKQDSGGNCTAVPKTGCTTDTFNAANQLVSIDYSDTSTPDVTNLTYDADGHRLAMTDGSGTTSYAWDSLGRQTSAASPAGTVNYGYDLRDLQTSIDYPNSLGTVTKTYDDAGHLSSIADWLNHSTSYDYDADGDQTIQTNPNATTSTTEFDAAARNMAMAHAPTTMPTTPFLSFGYGRDAGDKLTSVTSTGVPTDNHVWTYSNIDQLTGDTAKTFPYANDSAGNLTQLGDGANQSFDAANQLISSIGLVGTAGAANSNATTAVVTLPAGVKANDQILISATLPANVNVTTPTGFTLVGSWQTGNNASNTKVYLFRKTAVGGEASVTVTFSATVAKTVNAAVYRGVDSTSPIEATSSATSSTSSVVIPSVTPSLRGSNLFGVLGATQGASQSAVWTAPSGMVKRTEQSIAATDGAITDQMLPSSGATGTRTATLGTTGKLVGVLAALKPAQSYSYDGRGNRVTKTTGTATTSYGYDQANRLVSYTSGATTTTYAYNGDGLRVSRAGTNPATFAWDSSGSTPDLLSEGTTAYIYGPDGIPLEQINGTNVLYYHRDQLGSVRGLTDSVGNVVATYSYDAYGNLSGSTGSAPNPFGFSGQYKDSESGLTYLRARVYDPATGQFLTRDPITSITQAPYSYASGNPLNGTDPSGLCVAGLFGKDCNIAKTLTIGAAIVGGAALIIGTGGVAAAAAPELIAGFEAADLAATTIGGAAELVEYGQGLATVSSYLSAGSSVLSAGAAAVTCYDGISANCIANSALALAGGVTTWGSSLTPATEALRSLGLAALGFGLDLGGFVDYDRLLGRRC